MSSELESNSRARDQADSDKFWLSVLLAFAGLVLLYIDFAKLYGYGGGCYMLGLVTIKEESCTTKLRAAARMLVFAPLLLLTGTVYLSLAVGGVALVLWLIVGLTHRAIGLGVYEPGVGLAVLSVLLGSTIVFFWMQSHLGDIRDGVVRFQELD